MTLFFKRCTSTFIGKDEKNIEQTKYSNKNDNDNDNVGKA